MKSYGITQKTEDASLLDYYLEVFKIRGFVIIEDVLSPTELEDVRKALDRSLETQEADYSSEDLDRIGEKNMVRAPLQYDSLFVNLATHPKLMPLVKAVLGDNFVLHLQNGIVNMPNEEHHQSSWHRDLPYQNFVSSVPLGCNLFYCIDDFNADTGGTWMVPFSHREEYMPSNAYLNAFSEQTHAKAGSVIFFNSMVFHRAGYNSSQQIRRGINNVYVTPILKQQIDLPRLLEGKYADDPELATLLGYRFNPEVSIQEFRNKRINR